MPPTKAATLPQVRISPVTCWLILALVFGGAMRVACQLPDDIQRELNQNLAEQARIQALQQQQQHQRQLLQSRAAGQQQGQQQAAPQDPNNYSYQQVSPPIQYSYYQPFGDAAQQPNQQQQQQPVAAPGAAQQRGPTAADFDLNNLNFEMPQPQAQASTGPAGSAGAAPQVQLTPSFTGVGGLPVMKPVAASVSPQVPVGQPPLAPQAQQGPPLTEADFKDITGGENYGAPGGNDFGLGDAGSSSATGSGRAGDNTDAQLREFGLPASMSGGNRRGGSNSAPIETSAQNMNIPDFGAFNPIGAMNGGGGRQRSSGGESDPAAEFGNLDGMGGGGGSSGRGNQRSNGGEFDFASQPSSASQQAGGDQAALALNGGAPGSLQSLLGAGFPGLGGGGGNGRSSSNGGGLDGFASGGNDPQAEPQRQGDGSMDIADLGEKADQFSGADLGGFEQPTPSNDQDFNYAAASEQQPSSVPYPDGNPQPVGTLWALTQPQSLTQTRYNALPDKGTYQDYPAYQSDGNGLSGVTEVVDATPRARRPGPGRYGMPSPKDLAPEYRRLGGAIDYATLMARSPAH